MISLENFREKPLNAVLLEDYASDAELVEYYLKESYPNCILTHVSNEIEFKQVMLENEPDIVLSDFNLPNYSALDAFSELQEKYSDIPFIIISGELKEKDAVKLIIKGVDDYLLKSSLTRIGIAVGQALQRRNSMSKMKSDTQAIESNLEFINSILNDSGMAICEIEIPLQAEFFIGSQIKVLSPERLKDFFKSFEICRVNQHAVELFEFKDFTHFREDFAEIFDLSKIKPVLDILKSAQDEKIVKAKRVQLKSFKGHKRHISLNLISRVIDGRISMILSFLDQTAQRESEERTEKLLVRMESTIFEKTKQLVAINEQLTIKAKEVETANEILEYNFNQTTSSIEMAKKIQALNLPKIETIKEFFSDAFVFYQPKDIVSGDFYWYHENEKHVWLSVADCTGHGVPGALLAMTGCHLLSEIVNKNKGISPCNMLHKLDQHIVERLRQRDSGNAVSTGMDISICRINKEKQIMEFSGAFQDLYLKSESGIRVIKGDRRGLGGTHIYKVENFNTHFIPVKKGDKLYFTSDGILDQFGGSKGKKFMRKQFVEILSRLKSEDMKGEKEEIRSAYYNWKQKNDQVDDIVVMGLEI